MERILHILIMRERAKCKRRLHFRVNELRGVSLIIALAVFILGVQVGISHGRHLQAADFWQRVQGEADTRLTPKIQEEDLKDKYDYKLTN